MHCRRFPAVCSGWRRRRDCRRRPGNYSQSSPSGQWNTANWSTETCYSTRPWYWSDVMAIAGNVTPRGPIRPCSDWSLPPHKFTVWKVFFSSSRHRPCEMLCLTVFLQVRITNTVLKYNKAHWSSCFAGTHAAECVEWGNGSYICIELAPIFVNPALRLWWWWWWWWWRWWRR